MTYQIVREDDYWFVLKNQEIILEVIEVLNPFHPYHVNLVFQHKVEEEKVYELFLKEVMQVHQKLKISFNSGKYPVLSRVLFNNHFELKRRCFEFSKKSAEMILNIETSLVIQPFQKISKEWMEFFISDYRFYHETISPLSRDLTAEMFWHNIKKDIQLEMSFYYQVDNKRAYWFTEKVSDTHAYIAYIGGDLSETAMLHFYTECLSLLIEMGIQVFDFEIDNVNIPAMLLEQIMSFPKESYDAYVWEREFNQK